MLFCSRRILLAATFAAVAASFAPRSASAEVKAYCSNKVAADSFYKEVRSNGSSSTVTYWLQLRNKTSNPVKYQVFFDAQQSKERATGAWLNLSPNGSNRVKLGVDTFGNPSGNGALNENHDLPALTRVNCQ